jgi:vanillate O-demethylase monooxygenase subunit
MASHPPNRAGSGPLSSPFVRDCWYVAAWSHEVPAGGLFSRTVLGEPLLLMRRGDGTLTALLDRCSHRLAPLSIGTREGDHVRCAYHGIRFDGAGRCVEVPGSERVPPNLDLRTYPVVEHRRWVFVWMGDPAKADPALLPDNHSNDSPDWVHEPGYMHYDVPYLLICDNLLDFSHLSYVHATTLGGSPEIARARQRIEPVRVGERQVGVRITREVNDVPPSPYWRSFRPGLAGDYRRWFRYDFVLPGILLMDSGGHPVDAPDDDARTVRLHSCQALTPETETSTHYFFQQACQRQDFERSPQTPQRMHEVLLKAFVEDRDMITAQYRAILATPQLPMQPVPLDAGLGQFRALVERLAKAEA